MARVLAVLVLVLAVASANPVNPRNGYRNHSGVCDLTRGQVQHLGMNKVMPLKTVEFDYCRSAGLCPTNMKAVTNGVERCTNGYVDVHEHVTGLGKYACNNVDLMSYVSSEDLGSSLETSDIWGATVTLDNGDVVHIAIVGHSDGTSFVDITDSLDPVVLGFLPTFDCGPTGFLYFGVCSKNKIWRDIKVYGDRAFIVSENWSHGMQVVDLKNLYSDGLRKGHARVSARATPQTLTADYHYDNFGNAHNIALNEETGYAYVIGSDTCAGGLHVIDVHAYPPVYAGCFADDGYTHDCQCLNYKDSYPDSRYHGKEICLNFNEDTLTIVDVSDKDAMTMISRISYNGVQYSHQGWLTEDGRHILLDDELDEQQGSTYIDNSDTVEHGGHTRTLVWDVSDLENPSWVTSHLSEQTAIDHNLYILDQKAYMSNYCAGLRVMDITDPEAMFEEAYFDLAPYCSGTSFQGSWSNFPYFDNHPDSHCDAGVSDDYQCVIVVVSSIERGLYTLRVKTAVA